MGCIWCRPTLPRSNDPTVETLRALAYRTGRGVAQDDQQALAWLRKAAEPGHAQAVELLSRLYPDHAGYLSDDEETARLLRKLKDPGNAEAQAELRQRYAEGKGVPQDFGLSNHWLGIAATRGQIKAVALLADHYAHGLGVAEDHSKAYALYACVVAAQGRKPYIDAMNELEGGLPPVEAAEARKKCEFWQQDKPLPVTFAFVFP